MILSSPSFWILLEPRAHQSQANWRTTGCKAASLPALPRLPGTPRTIPLGHPNTCSAIKKLVSRTCCIQSTASQETAQWEDTSPCGSAESNSERKPPSARSWPVSSATALGRAGGGHDTLQRDFLLTSQMFKNKLT